MERTKGSKGNQKEMVRKYTTVSVDIETHRILKFIALSRRVPVGEVIKDIAGVYLDNNPVTIHKMK